MRAVCLFLLFACAVMAQSSPEQLFREAAAAQQTGNDAVAVKKYRELLKLRPDVMEARANLGAVLARMGRFDEAITEYRAALAKSPGNPGLQFNLALAYYKKGDFAEAAKQLAAMRGGDPRVATLLADCYARLGQDAQVIGTLAPIEKTRPDDLAIAWLLGSSMIRAGHPREGLERVEKVARRGNEAEAYLLAGRTALKLNDFERARDHADAAVRLNPNLPGAQTLRGTVLQYLGDNQGALTALRKAVAADAKDFDAQLALGAVLLTERDIETAQQHLEKALALNPDSTLALYEMARVDRQQQRWEDAVKRLERVVREDPQWAQAHLDLATAYFRLKRAEDGQRERAIYDKLIAAREKPGKSPTSAPER